LISAASTSSVTEKQFTPARQQGAVIDNKTKAGALAEHGRFYKFLIINEK